MSYKKLLYTAKRHELREKVFSDIIFSSGIASIISKTESSAYLQVAHMHTGYWLRF